MVRVVIAAACAALLVACGPKKYSTDAGVEEIDAGPPPVDAGRPRGDDAPLRWTTAVELPATAAATTRLGVSLSAAPDQYGQPLIAGVYDDPNGDGLKQDDRVFFTRWNGVDKKFQDLKTLEVVGEIELGHPHRQVSLARDEVTGRLAVAFVKGTDTIRVAFSDDEGETFSLVTASDNSAGLTVSDPALAVKNGSLYLAFRQGEQVVYRQQTAAGTWSSQTPPLGAADTRVFNAGLALALDSAGHPALAYFGAPALDTPHLLFWRPGSATATEVATAGTVLHTDLNRAPSVSLAFAGELPRVAYHLRSVEPLATADNTPELSYAVATDAAGTAWGTPIGIPRNGDNTKSNSTRWYQALTVEGVKANVAANFAANGLVGALCGGPKLARTENGTFFQTCSPTGSPYNFAGEWVNAWNHAPGKLTVLFHYDQRANPNGKPGIAMWREP